MEVKLGFVESMRIDMERKGLSEADVGKALGISQQAVGKWLNRGYPPMSRVEALRALLGADGSFAKLTHEDLFGGRATRTPDPYANGAPTPADHHIEMLARLFNMLPKDQSLRDKVFAECAKDISAALPGAS